MKFQGRAGALILLVSGTLLAQEGEIRIRSAEVVPGLYMLDGANGRFAGGNMGLLTGDDGIVLIDDGLEVISPALLGAISELVGEPVAQTSSEPATCWPTVRRVLNGSWTPASPKTRSSKPTRWRTIPTTGFGSSSQPGG